MSEGARLSTLRSVRYLALPSGAFTQKMMLMTRLHTTALLSMTGQPSLLRSPE